jgi:hypothetical protein
MRATFFIGVLFCCLLFSCSQVRQENALSEEVLIHAFETGRSLVIAKIISVHAKKEGSDVSPSYFYKAEVIEPIILGDLSEQDIKKPLELCAGASYGHALEVGGVYTLFVIKDAPYFFSWAHRDNVLKVNLWTIKEIHQLVSKAKRIYENSSICQFREVEETDFVTFPDISDELKIVCEQFRSKQNDRTKFAKLIYTSDLGSRADKDNQFTSMSHVSYLPPKLKLSRQQALLLFGEPTLKLGYTYYWFCGIDLQTDDKCVGVLVVTFNKGKKSELLLYKMRAKEYWLKDDVSATKCPTISEKHAEFIESISDNELHIAENDSFSQPF